MPATSVSLFVQASAPAGWTKIATTDDRMLRVVSGTGAGSGGSNPISSGITLAHTHAVTAVADHTHSIPNHTHQINSGTSLGGFASVAAEASFVQADGSGNLVTSADVGPSASRTCYNNSSTSSGGGLTSAAGAHTHTLPTALDTIRFAYIDVIQCSKDSAGAPYSYTDMTAVFAWKKLVSHQRLNNLAKNDAYIQYHTTPANTGMLFYMTAAPTGWTKVTTHHDKAIRIVSGGTGGTPGGGSHLVSEAIVLAHTHPINAGGGHTHVPSHTHDLASGVQTANAPTATVVEARSSAFLGSGHSGGNIQASSTLKNVSAIPTEIIINAAGADGLLVADPDHSHGGATSSALTNVSLAYADVIWCTKN
jgi:hypothetical protein